MIKVGLYDAKPYDIEWFNKFKTNEVEINYFEHKLNEATVSTAQGLDATITFVNDTLNAAVIEKLRSGGVQLAALRCTGFNNVDFMAAYENKLCVTRVPVYSPYAVAEHAMALLQCLNRKIHRAYIRTRDFNFTLNGLQGIDFHGKTVGVIGTGKIGQAFIAICKGYGMDVLAYDPYPNQELGVRFVSLEELLHSSDIVSLHCPLNEQTHHIISREHLAWMKPTAMLVNTSRGALVDSHALLDVLREKKLGAAALDVYEEESDYFFSDYSGAIISDDVLSLLLSLPNVIITSHQAFLTAEALDAIAQVTLQNIDDYFAGRPLPNEICYHCMPGSKPKECQKRINGRCFTKK